MTLYLTLVGDLDEESFARVAAILHRKFEVWPERVDVKLEQSPKGWVIPRATATIIGTAPSEKTSWVVLHEVRTALEDAGEPIA